MENTSNNNIEQNLGIKIVNEQLEDDSNLNSQPTKKHKVKKNKKQQGRLNQFSRFVTLNLNQKDKLKREWYLILGLSILFILFFGILLGFMQFFTTVTSSTSPAVHNARNLNEAMRIMSIIAIVLLALPYLYLGAAFFSGINQIHKSKSVHIFIWFTFIINALLLIICCCILIAAYYGLDATALSAPFQ